MSYFTAPSPFFDIPRDALVNRFHEIAAECATEFRCDLEQLQTLIRQTNPLALISIAGHMTMCSPVDQLGIRTDLGPQYFQSHIELLQAFVLAQDPATIEPQFVEPAASAAVMDCLKRLSDNFTRKRLNALSLGDSEEKRNSHALIEQFRVHTQDVRNFGYLGQMSRVYRELLEPLDNDLRSAFGVRGSAIIDCFARISEISDVRRNDYLQRLTIPLEEQSPRAAVLAYGEAFCLVDEDRERLLGFVEKSELRDDDLRHYLIWQALNGLHVTHLWTMEDWCDLLDAQPESAAAIVDSWAHCAGDLAESNLEHLFLGNPVWDKPLIRLDEQCFYLGIAPILMTHALRLIENLVSKNAGVKKRYEERRSAFLENAIGRCISSALPSAKVFAGSEWKCASSEKQGENDLLVIHNGIALVIEAKAHGVTDPAKRGAIGRIKQKIDELVVKPANQAHDFIEFLKGHSGMVTLPSSKGGTNVINIAEIEEYVPIAVSFEPIASEHSCWILLRNAGLVPADVDPVIAFSYWDMEILCEILDEELLLQHYLQRRLVVERRVKYTGDELDLLVTYLETGLAMPQNLGNSVLYMLDLTSRLHPYFMKKDIGLVEEKPTRRLTPWWKEMVKAVARKREPIRRLAAFALLDVPHENQVALEEEFNRVKSRVRLGRRAHRVMDSFVFESGSLEERYGIVFFAVSDRLWNAGREKMHASMESLASDVMSDGKYSFVFVFAVHVDVTDLPYSTFVAFRR